MMMSVMKCHVVVVVVVGGKAAEGRDVLDVQRRFSAWVGGVIASISKVLENLDGGQLGSVLLEEGQKIGGVDAL